MAEEKSFLQTIKLEISRSFKLVPYERLAFHKILGILKSDVGMSILIKEMEKGSDIRRSAIAVLVSFDKPEAMKALVSYLGKNISDEERVMILDHVKRRGGADVIKDIIALIESFQTIQVPAEVLGMSCDVLKTVGAVSE